MMAIELLYLLAALIIVLIIWLAIRDIRPPTE